LKDDDDDFCVGPETNLYLFGVVLSIIFCGIGWASISGIISPSMYTIDLVQVCALFPGMVRNCTWYNVADGDGTM
jgi:hypothetical protein